MWQHRMPWDAPKRFGAGMADLQPIDSLQYTKQLQSQNILLVTTGVSGNALLPRENKQNAVIVTDFKAKPSQVFFIDQLRFSLVDNPQLSRVGSPTGSARGRTARDSMESVSAWQQVDWKNRPICLHALRKFAQSSYSTDSMPSFYASQLGRLRFTCLQVVQISLVFLGILVAQVAQGMKYIGLGSADLRCAPVTRTPRRDSR